MSDLPQLKVGDRVAVLASDWDDRPPVPGWAPSPAPQVGAVSTVNGITLGGPNDPDEYDVAAYPDRPFLRHQLLKLEPDTPAAVTRRFTVTPLPDGSLAIDGPKDYMDARGSALIDAIATGSDPMFLMTAHLSPTMEIAVAVRLQTDYAGWKGTKDFFDAHGPH